MNARAEREASPHGGRDAERAAERLVALANSLIEAREGEPERVVADLAALRAEVDRIAGLCDAAGGPQGLLAPLCASLAAAGLREIAYEGAPIAAIQAALARLHGLVTALSLARVKKKP
jgi:hypothetical protein